MEQTTVMIGACAESAATRLLEDRGYRIFERNFRCRIGELDIVAYDGAVLVFVEVRSRANDEHGHALEMIGPAKQRQVARIAGHFLAARCPIYDEIRFDVIAITGDDVMLVQDAWRE